MSLRPLLEILTLPPNQGQRNALCFIERGDHLKRRVQFRPAYAGDPFWISRRDLRGNELEALEHLARDGIYRGRAEVFCEDDARLRQDGWNAHLKRIRFAGFSPEQVVKPHYLIERIEALLNTESCGALRVEGPGGCGKSFLARFLQQRWRGTDAGGIALLPFYAVAGQGADPLGFVDELQRQIMNEADRLEPTGIYLNRPSDEQKPLTRELFGEYLETLVQSSLGYDRIILLIDGLDEIRPAGSEVSILDLLPSQLPERLYLVLIGRGGEELDPKVRQALAELPWLAGSPVAIHTALDSGDERAAPNRELLEKYLERFYAKVLDKPQRQAVIDASGGRFLYLATLADGIEQGAFDIARGLPEPGRIFAAYLEWMVARMAGVPSYGRALERTVALLAAAALPVPMECLVDWGIDERWVEELLLDLKGLLAREHQREGALIQGRREPYMYRIYHQEFTAHLRNDPRWQARIAQAHRDILDALATPRAGLWGDEQAVDLKRPEDTYALLGLAHHLQVLGVRDVDAGGVTVADRLAAASRLHDWAIQRQLTLADHEGALHCMDQAEALIAGYLVLGDEPQRKEARRLAMAILGNRSSASLAAGRHAEAMEAAAKALTAAKEIWEEDQDNPDTLQDLSVSLERMGDACRAEGDNKGAREHFQEALELDRLRIERFGESPDTLQGLSVSLSRMGRLLEKLGDEKQAEALFQEALEALSQTMPPGRARLQVALSAVDSSRDAQERLAALDEVLTLAFELGKEQQLEADDLHLLAERVFVDYHNTALGMNNGKGLGTGLQAATLFGYLFVHQALGMDAFVKHRQRDRAVAGVALERFPEPEAGKLRERLEALATQVEQADAGYAKALREL